MLRVLNTLFFLLFFAAMVLNYNDPDPHLWMPVYGLSALWCVWHNKWNKIPAYPVAAYAVGCIFWAVYVWMDLDNAKSLWDQEAFREGAGLLICAAWSLTLVRRTLKMKQFMFITT